jgi:hypothetical protein
MSEMGTTDRLYRNALLPEKAFSIMKEEVKRGWRDGSLVDQLEMLVVDSAPRLTGVGAKNEL